MRNNSFKLVIPHSSHLIPGKRSIFTRSITMKKIQSVLCAVALAISLSSTILAGDIHGVRANAEIHGVSTKGDIHGTKGNFSGLLTWGDITGVIVSIFGDIHG
jgi:hypothetical protein